MRWSLYDKIIDIKYNQEISAIKIFDNDDEIFNDHFPSYPVVPGVLLLESMAQVGGRLISISKHHESKGNTVVFPVMSIVNKSFFKKAIKPGEEILIKAKIIDMHENDAKIIGKIFLKENILSVRAEIIFTIFYLKHLKGLNSLFNAPETAGMTTLNNNINEYLKNHDNYFIKLEK